MTPEARRREDAKALYAEILGIDSTLSLTPDYIRIEDKGPKARTKVSFCYFEKEKKKKKISFKGVESSGFVDAVFSECLAMYSTRYPSLNNIRLLNFLVTPPNLFQTQRNYQDPSGLANICFTLGVKRCGKVEFTTESNSLVFSSFEGVLSIFEFYINCEKAFHKLRFTYDNAKERNRGDIQQECQVKMVELINYNCYDTV